MLWLQLNHPLAEYEVKQRWLTLQAKTLIEKNLQAYEALVTAMASQASVVECRQLIQRLRAD